MPVRLASIDELEAERWVRPGDTVIWGQARAEPLSLTEALMGQRQAVGGFRCLFGMQVSDTLRPEHADNVELISYTAAGGNFALAREGALQILPIHYSDYPRFFADGRLAADVVLLQLSPPDREGRHSLGFADEWLSAAIDAARIVLAEVNDQVPWTNSRLLREDELDLIVETSRRPAPMPVVAPGEVEHQIGRNVAALIGDGATLQTGIGALPDAILGALDGHAELGIHTGSLGDRALDLIEAGVVTNARKTVDPGITVAAVLMGGDRLARFADRNAELALRDTRYTHDAARLASQPEFVAINSAFEVDLTGQINSEVAAGQYRGAVGGAIDFLRGAARSPGGLPIVALPSASRGRSRIVARLSGPVSTPRADAGVIVTEQGSADLRGLTLSRRRRAMLALVHPDHRDSVAAEARELG